MSTRLPRPIGTGLLDRCDEAQVARIWRGVSGRRAARAARRSLLRAGLVGMGVTATAAVLLTVWHLRSGATPGPIAMLDAAPVPGWLRVGPRSTRSVRFDDGSSLTLAAGAQLRTIENSGRRFSVELTCGRARFEVKPGGPRRWTVEAGLATVSVVGTVFDVERSEGGVRIAVERGRVEVRGPKARLSRLRAGEELSFTPAVDRRSRNRPSEPPASLPSAAVPAASRRAPTQMVPRQAQAPMPPAAETWFDAADAARREGRFDEALAALKKAVEGSDDAGAAIAAFTRARLELDSLHRPADAAKDLELALTRGLPAALAEEARARLVEAYDQAHRSEEARAAASDYMRHHPAGRWARRVGQRTR